MLLLNALWNAIYECMVDSMYTTHYLSCTEDVLKSISFDISYNIINGQPIAYATSKNHNAYRIGVH